MNRAPAFQFYPKDWFDFKVQRMSLKARGAYLQILCFMWNDSKDQCSIIDDNELISKALGIQFEEWVPLRGEMQVTGSPLFYEKKGKLYSDRLKRESMKQRNYRQLQHLKGVLSAKARLNRGSGSAQPKPNSSSSSLSSSFKEQVRKVFVEIWHQYPNKDGKTIAEKKYLASIKTEQDLADIKTALTNYLGSRRVHRGYVKNGGTWFGQWRDWVNFKEPFCTKCKGTGKFTSSTGYVVACTCEAGKVARP